MTDRDHYTDTLLDFALRDFHGKESPPDLSGRIVAAVTARSLSPSHGEERGKGKIIAHPRPRWIGIATAAASVVIGLMLIVLGPERHQKPVSFEARYEIENNEIKLLEGWLLIDSASPLLRTDNGHVESVRGKVLARAGGVPDRAALEAAAEWFDTTLTQEERTMLGNTKRWINTGSVALIALSGSFVCNGVTYTAQDGVAGEVPSDGVAAKTWAESFEVIENVFDKQSGTTMTETFAPSAQLIVDANAWEAFWDKLWEIEKQRSKRADLGTPNIDFTKYAVIAVIDRVEYMEPTDAGDDTGAGIELEAIYREVRTSDDIACVLRCKPVTSKGETILWRDPVTAGDAKKRGPFDDAMSRTLYGCFVVPAADAPQPGKVRVEYQLRTMAVPGKSRIDLTKEGILDSWKYLGTLSIGVARNPKWFKENIIQVEHYLPETAAYTSLLDGGAAYDGQVKDQSGNVVKNLIRYYSVDERVQTVGDRTDQVKRQFDTGE